MLFGIKNQTKTNNQLQRRLERYKIIYTWRKVLEGLIPNFGINYSINKRRGRECTIPVLRESSAIKRLREQSFQMAGPRLFNCLPINIRNFTKASMDDFKEKLDFFLATLPDQPKVGDLIPSVCNQLTAKPSNSLLDVSNYKKSIYGGGYSGN